MLSDRQTEKTENFHQLLHGYKKNKMCVVKYRPKKHSFFGGMAVVDWGKDKDKTKKTPNDQRQIPEFLDVLPLCFSFKLSFSFLSHPFTYSSGSRKEEN